MVLSTLSLLPPAAPLPLRPPLLAPGLMPLALLKFSFKLFRPDIPTGPTGPTPDLKEPLAPTIPLVLPAAPKRVPLLISGTMRGEGGPVETTGEERFEEGGVPLSFACEETRLTGWGGGRLDAAALGEVLADSEAGSWEKFAEEDKDEMNKGETVVLAGFWMGEEVAEDGFEPGREGELPGEEAPALPPLLSR